MNNTTHVLCYTQKLLVITRPMEYLRFRESSAGISNVVAILCYIGYNQEDILNGRAIDRDSFRSAFYRTYKSTKYNSLVYQEEQFEIPSSLNLWKKKLTCEKRHKKDKYGKLDDYGIVAPGVAFSVSNEDIIIEKMTILPEVDDELENKVIKVIKRFKETWRIYLFVQ